MAVKRIAVRGVNWVGDAVMTTPALRSVRLSNPGAHITLLVKKHIAGLFEKDPSIDQIMVLGDECEGASGKLRLARRLKSGGFDEIILLQNAFGAGLSAWLARIPRRTGYSRDLRGPLLTKPVPYGGEDRRMHHVDYYLNLLEKAGLCRVEKSLPWVHLTPEERLKARQLLQGLERPVIALTPGAAFGSSKRWPVGSFIKLADLINTRLGGSVALLGSASEAQAAQQIIREASSGPGRILDLAGKTGVREFAAVLSECDAVVSNDSGAMHVAYAVGSRVVALFGSTSPELTGPPGHSTVMKKQYGCSPCFKRTCAKGGAAPPCLEAISPDEVFEALRNILPSRRAVFFDRDGVLCKDPGYLSRWEDFEPAAGLEQLVKLRDMGFAIIGITNQSGINRGTISEDFVKEVNAHFGKYGFEAFYYCPHRPDEICSCRKPSPGMLLEASRQLNIDLKGSYMVGDKTSDILAASSAGAFPVLIGSDGPADIPWAGPFFRAGSLKEAVEFILKREAC
ncbi:MAG: lipopolysaccharide heptosyltransferase II [Actinomycetota bacterium]|nr:lipopolysaccharide heptosyltransferase II [Actinomycetota bacterium]